MFFNLGEEIPTLWTPVIKSGVTILRLFGYIKPANHFTDELDILEREKEKTIKNLWKSAKCLVVVGIPSGLKSERKIRGALKEASEKNNALRILKPRFEGSIN
ncbi:hypothetical protein AVEN_182506-1 [Araneus ventricosus]|uniref:Uncharacterized protein n=1 Tax=Araneus ventricosus TaxID=182803 RepID=A0A4Y2BXM8_ARAVE|nr:hypothetical protein AVEN_182506-1 [Araneus ventricosus]